MTEQEVMQTFYDTKSLLKGHFLLRSGLHSDHFFQCALLLQYTDVAARLCAELASRFADQQVELVISPALGGVVVGQEVGRALGVRAIFAEKDEESNLHLRRGFTIRPGERVLVAEDVVTKGGRVQQTIDLVRQHGGVVVGVAVIVNRGDVANPFDVPMKNLVRLQFPTWSPEECPLCKEGTKAEKPGSK